MTPTRMGMSYSFALSTTALTRSSGSDVPRIDPDLISTAFHGGNGQPVIKMDIRHQRDMDLPFDLGGWLSAASMVGTATRMMSQPAGLQA